MATTSVDRRVEQVIAMLGEMKALHDELCMVVKRKLDALRRADVDAIQSATAREDFLARRIHECDGMRKQVMELIATSMGVARSHAREMTVSELADRVGEPASSRLVVLAAALRDRIRETAEANRVAALITQEMLKHFRHVYDVMATANQQPGVYTRSGSAAPRRAVSVFEAVV